MMMFRHPENATPIDDLSDLKLPWVKVQEDLNIVEAENISIAISKHLSNSVNLPPGWFNISTLKKIHRDMLSDVWEWAGMFRKTQTSIGVKPYQISGALESLCSEVQYWCSEACELTLVEQAARVHHQLVLIHPFLNGNGRFSRLVSDRYLKAWKCPFPIWPTEMNRDGSCRKCYIASLKEADAGDHEALVQYMIRYGAKDPELSQLLGHTFFRQNFKGKRMVSLVKAYIRRGHHNNEEESGHQPLNIALRHGLSEVALLLITNGANFKRKDHSGLNGFEWALTKEFYDLAHEMVRRGYPYTPRQPNPQLKVPDRNLYRFDSSYC
ncbi:MAG: mobile mystery protein B [Chlamydiia bacterium]|nr:mobile mystery protein B [Chlamydiia bacterium]